MITLFIHTEIHVSVKMADDFITEQVNLQATISDLWEQVRNSQIEVNFYFIYIHVAHFLHLVLGEVPGWAFDRCPDQVAELYEGVSCSHARAGRSQS